ncbi:hypothetical protein [Lawsonella clevelandensis]|nr:hypothetical protein [Lawsonella clevelandensis]
MTVFGEALDGVFDFLGVAGADDNAGSFFEEFLRGAVAMVGPSVLWVGC